MFYLSYLCLFDSSLPPPVSEVKTNQTNTNNVNKTWILLQTGGGKDDSSKHK
jgi:hypothetical protein